MFCCATLCSLEPSPALRIIAHVSRDAQLQNRAREQIRTVVSGDDALTDKQVEQLPLVDAMISEAMRLYPPGWLLMRRAQESDEVLGFAVPRGSFVVAPVYALHRHPDYFKRVNGIADNWPLCHEPRWKIDRATPFRDGN